MYYNRRNSSENASFLKKKRRFLMILTYITYNISESQWYSLGILKVLFINFSIPNLSDGTHLTLPLLVMH